MADFLLSGYGFGEKGPFLLLDDLSSTQTIRKKFYLHNKELTIRRLPERYCIGGYNLGIGDFETCPKRSKIAGNYTVCLFCRDKSGFNPAFYNSDHISPKQEIYNQRPHIAYLANFGIGVTKVGIAARIPERWLEQGARLATIIKHCGNAYEARKLEEETRDLLGITEAVSNKAKRGLICSYNLSEGKKEIEKLRDRLASESSDIEMNEILSFDKNYLNAYKLNPGAIDLTGNDFVSGRFMGMIGDILILEQDGLQFMAGLKLYIGHMMSIEKEIIKNEYIESKQQSLF